MPAKKTDWKSLARQMGMAVLLTPGMTQSIENSDDPANQNANPSHQAIMQRLEGNRVQRKLIAKERYKKNHPNPLKGLYGGG